MRLVLFLTLWLYASGLSAGAETLRGMVTVETEPVWTGRESGAYPLTMTEAREAALSGAALYFAGMIYGWDFEYDPAGRLRGGPEHFDWQPAGTIPAEPPLVPDMPGFERDGSLLRLWVDYEPGPAETGRRNAWKTGQLRTLTARGRAGLDGTEPQAAAAALQDAARNAVRSLARGAERELPRTIRGRMALAGFPVVTIAHGEWAALARFYIDIGEIEPFGAR